MNANTTTPTDPKLIKHDPHCIERSPYQPRRRFDEAEMSKLTESVKEIGLIQPLVARPHPTKEGWLEQLVGERRLRACVAAELPFVPVLLRTGLTDQQAEQIVLEENLQREDLTTSEEGHAFQRLLQMTDATGKPVHTQKSVAEFVHKDVDYVVSRLKLLVCPEELVTAVDDGTVAVSVALLVGRIPDPKARSLCAKQVLHPELQQVPLNYVQTKEHIREHFMVALNKKHFDLDDANLVPVKLDADGERCHGGSCMDCPFRSGNLEGIELQNGSSRNSGISVRGSSMGADTMLCTLPRCHKLKLDAVWKDKKLAAERAGKKTLDGPAAERAFGGHNGDLAHDSGLTDLKHAQRVAADHGVKLEDIEVQRIVARHPDTLEVHELVDWKKAYPAILTAEEAAQKQRKAQPKTDHELQQEADDKQRKAEESRREKLDKLCLHESLTEIVNRITAKGMDLEFLDLAFQLALGMSGADGMYAVGKWLEIKLPKGTANSGRDYEDEILKILREKCQTSNAWLAHIVIALIARGVKWNGVRCEDFELVLTRCGFKVKEIERRAKALLQAEQKPSAPKAPKAAASKNSTDPSDVSVEKEAGKTAAADKQGKKKLVKVINASLSGSSKNGLAAAAAKAVTSGPSASEIVTGIQDTKIGKPERWNAADVEAGAKLIKAGTHKIADLIGPPPIRKEKLKLKNYNAVRLRLMRKAGKVK